MSAEKAKPAIPAAHPAPAAAHSAPAAKPVPAKAAPASAHPAKHAAPKKDKSANPMREVLLEKVTLNIGAGESGPKLEKSKAILEKIAGRKAVEGVTRKRTTFNVPQGQAIGVKVTFRGKAAEEMLKRMLHTKDNKLKFSSFDSTGNVSFGVHEYINIPGVKYDPAIGIMGMDVCITLKRRGYRIKKRKLRYASVGKGHQIKPQDAMEFMKSKFGVQLVEKEDKYVL